MLKRALIEKQEIFVNFQLKKIFVIMTFARPNIGIRIGHVDDEDGENNIYNIIST